jgi:hypothetical protein
MADQHGDDGGGAGRDRAASGADALRARAASIGNVLSAWGSKVKASMPSGQEVKTALEKGGEKVSRAATTVGSKLPPKEDVARSLARARVQVRLAALKALGRAGGAGDGVSEITAFDQSTADWEALRAAVAKLEALAQKEAVAQAELAALLEGMAARQGLPPTAGAEGELGEEGDAAAAEAAETAPAVPQGDASQQAFAAMLAAVAAGHAELGQRAAAHATRLSSEVLAACALFGEVVARDAGESVRRHRKVRDAYNALRREIAGRTAKEMKAAGLPPPPPVEDAELLDSGEHVSGEGAPLPELPASMVPSPKLKEDRQKLEAMKPQFDASKAELAEKLRITADKSRRDLIEHLGRGVAEADAFHKACQESLEGIVSGAVQTAKDTPSDFQERGDIVTSLSA